MSSLEQIGQQLKAAREAQGLTLRQIYERTKIPMGHLMSIDGAQAEDLPEPVYVSGYIKRYAECVGLDAQALSDEYRQFAEESAGNGSRQHGGQSVVYSTPEYFSRSSRIDRGPPTFKTFYFNAFWIVVVVGIISYLAKVQFNNQVNQVDPALMALREATSKSGAGTNTQNAPTQAQTTPTTDNQQTADARITLSASQHVWVEVTSVSTGESKFTGFLEQGDRRDFQDPQGLRVHAGNGGSLTVEHQGKLETFGDAGKQTERTFMASSATETAGGAANEAARAPATTQAKPAIAAKRPLAQRKSDDQRLSSTRDRHYRRVEDLPSRQYIPGESLGGTRSIDVPYRYSEGRLDAE